MTELRVILDQLVAPIPGGIGRYAEELGRRMIETAPPGVDVVGFVPASPEERYAELLERLPGLARLEKSALDHRTLALAWQRGFIGGTARGMVHAMSIMAPLTAHDRVHSPGRQTVVTIHDAIPWTHPETLTSHGAAWHRAMGRRAERFADAVVVPTHAVADELGEVLDLGERIRVIGGAVGSRLHLPQDAEERADALDLPRRFVLSVGTLEPRKGIPALIQAMRHLPSDVELAIVGPAGWGDVDVAGVAEEAGVAGRVHALGRLSDEDLAVALAAAEVVAVPSLAEGFGLPILEAFSLETPVVHSDAPALVEVAGGAGITVERDEPEGYPERLAEGLRRVLDNPDLARRLGIEGRDRTRGFSWRDSAEKVWQLHADL
ncbi:glycosyltransferase family 1 protein [Homoserinibacter sp. GY 40078]|uniref:glycosyltransferase family 4 protein n=1 Tax=Homoserinibacter sp. GY 40078 TaxID=2603275 RepID=UPI0011C98E91|nr:glycosyltransferase family 1 protein [Homoserinibacter sp. GY 40078]TXK16242.1 glycosyltransferase family 4 protein [Homoserinibacter sp. GY 40078]